MLSETNEVGFPFFKRALLLVFSFIILSGCSGPPSECEIYDDAEVKVLVQVWQDLANDYSFKRSGTACGDNYDDRGQVTIQGQIGGATDYPRILESMEGKGWIPDTGLFDGLTEIQVRSSSYEKDVLGFLHIDTSDDATVLVLMIG